MPSVLFPPNLMRTIQQGLGLPPSEPPRVCYPVPPRVREVSPGVGVSKDGLISLRRMAAGGPAQNRRIPRNWHQEWIHVSDEVLLLSADVLARELRKYQYDPECRGVRRVPLRALARYAGVGWTVVHAAAAQRRISTKSRLRLSRAIREIKAGELSFVRRK